MDGHGGLWEIATNSAPQPATVPFWTVTSCCWQMFLLDSYIEVQSHTTCSRTFSGSLVKFVIRADKLCRSICFCSVTEKETYFIELQQQRDLQMMLTILVTFLCSFKHDFLTMRATGLSNSEMHKVWKETGEYYPFNYLEGLSKKQSTGQESNPRPSDMKEKCERLNRGIRSYSYRPTGVQHCSQIISK